MDTDLSYGILPFDQREGCWRALLVHHLHGGHWAFPKGHPEPGETAIECATRELLEETGLEVVQILRDGPFIEHYTFDMKGRHIDKTVKYFAARVSGSIKVQEEELLDCRWVPINDAPALLTFPEARRLLDEAIHAIPELG